MKNLLRVLIFIIIAVAVFFASDFLINQNEKYNSNYVTNLEDTIQTENSGDEILENLTESGEVIISGEEESFSGETLESGEILEMPEEVIAESGDEVVESGELVNN